MSEEASGEQFGSRIGLILTTMGAAVGTGNIWRFPREVAANGGGAFLVPWLIFVFMWSIPLIMAEFAIGKRTRMGPVGAVKDFAGKRYVWMGVWVLVVSTIIQFYYVVVMGWTIFYSWVGLLSIFDAGPVASGQTTQQIWDNFHNSAAMSLLFMMIALGLSCGLMFLGVKKGLERVSKILLPTLIFMLFCSMLFAITRPNAAAGLRFMFVIQWDKLWVAETWVRGLAQSAWSASAGMGVALTYGVYMKKNEDTSLNSAIAGLGNNAVELIAGIAVLCTVFALAANPHETVSSDATGLTFVHLTNLFLTGGRLLGPILVFMFFTAMAFAALTSMISHIEMAVRNLADHGMTRAKAVWIVTGVTFVFAIPAAISPAVFNNMDTVWGLGLMLCGLFIGYTVWLYGWRAYQKWREEREKNFDLMDFIKVGVPAFRNDLVNDEYADMHVPWLWDVALWIVFPIGVVVLVGWYTLQSILLNDNWWHFWDFQTTTISNVYLQWGLLMALLIALNGKVAALPTQRNIVAGEEDMADRFFDQQADKESDEGIVPLDAVVVYDTG